MRRGSGARRGPVVKFVKRREGALVYLSLAHLDGLVAADREHQVGRFPGGHRDMVSRSARYGLSRARVRPAVGLVIVGHIENLLTTHLADELGVAFVDVLLDFGDELILGFSFDIRAAFAMDNLGHSSSWSREMDDHLLARNRECLVRIPSKQRQRLRPGVTSPVRNLGARKGRFHKAGREMGQC